ncbi:MAG: hypothetical protein A2X93_03720 [Deltaproteobacteria bacterium GWC2_56_8]|nr:MAG: hypothetical protein A2X99_09240 [Deltaproteobacteria bacterium GWB2_55_19]OGP37696.1 MAG: hypothetical protein A2X93_03720 [Deltaproteobacteria bacterium GWC2_56_8]HAO93537.1 signal peptide peptidase SppA [Deltaproteobacteria bacterium]
MGEKIKTLLAAVGAVFVIVLVLSIAIAAFTGGAFSTSDKVAIVELEGIIIDPSETLRRLKVLEERDDVKAIVVRIDSPGGAVGPSQEIHGEIKRLREKKKVVASMGTIAASGGYYTAVAAERIVANPGTITGSIGVIVEFFNAEELLQKIGLKGYVVKSGKFKDVGSPLRKMEDEERKLLQAVIDDVNDQFIEAVAEGRGLKPEDVRAIADGRIFTGAQAKEKGLIDELGGLSSAIKLSAELAGIEGEPEVIYPERKDFGLLGNILGRASINNLTDLFSGLRVMYMLPKPE